MKGFVITGYRATNPDSKGNDRLSKEPPPPSPDPVSRTGGGSRVDIVRSRPQSVSRAHSRSQSNPRSGSHTKMYSVDNMGGEGRGSPDVSLAHLQEMRERSKILRDQVLGAQRSVQSKEEQLARLRNSRLPPDEIRKEETTLVRLTDRINIQEARLKKLRDTKTKIQQQVIINGAMTAELEGLKNILTNKQKDISDIDQVINQLNTRLQQAKVDRNTKNTKNSQYSERIGKLRQEMLAHNRVTESVQGKFSSQREAVQSKKDETSKIDLQISELWRKLQQAKAAQQQNTQKTATAIAAVEPYEHNPPETSFPVTDVKLSAHSKPQEIDIQLIERNGGSGQSSPSVSADEREPYSVRAVKPPPPLPALGLQNSTAIPKSSGNSQSSRDRIRSHDNNWSQQKPAVSGSKLEQNELSSRHEPVKTRSSKAEDSASRISSVGKETSARDGTANPRVSSPRQGPSSPRQGPSAQMKLEKGPVHQFKSNSNMSPSFSDPAISVNKPKNFNAKPKPFGVPSKQSPPTTGEDPSSAPVLTADAEKPSLQSSMNTSAPSISNQEGGLAREGGMARERGAARELSVPYSRSYQPVPIMGRQQLNSSSAPSNQSVSSSASQSSPQLNGSQSKQNGDSPSRGQPRYATRSQISDTYIPQVDPNKLDKYRRDMERAVRDLSISKQDNSTVAHPVASTTSPTNLVTIPPSTQRITPPTTQRTTPPTTHITTPATLRSTVSPTTHVILPTTTGVTSFTSTSATAPHIINTTVTAGSTNDRSQSNITSRVSPQLPSADDNQSLCVLEDKEGMARISSEPISSEDEPPSDHIIIYNPADTDNSQRHLKSIISKRRGDTVDGAVMSMRSHSGNARFHPLVILLDTALNGSVEEVNSILPKVEDPSASNDEGITALHNAICAGHMEIVRTLVEYGVDVNAVDTDGWTPLHCAASCNNQPVVEYLISCGACILAMTFSDEETAREKCEMDEEGYDGTSRCLYDAERKLGSDEPVYSVYAYNSENSDELTVKINDKLSILNRGDEVERDWWWARCEDGREGYVAKNLLAFTPRVLSNQDSAIKH